MADYLDADTLERLIPQVRINANSAPNEAMVAEMIDTVELVTNAAIATEFQAPINKTVSPRAWEFVRDGMSHCLAARVLRAMHTGISDGDMSGVREFQRLCEAFHASLLDVLRSTDAVPIAVGAPGRPKSFFGGEDQEFTREDVY